MQHQNDPTGVIEVDVAKALEHPALRIGALIGIGSAVGAACVLIITGAIRWVTG